MAEQVVPVVANEAAKGGGKLFGEVVYSKSSKIVHVANGSNETVDVIIKDNGADKQETCDSLNTEDVAMHRSTGWTNDSGITVCVRVNFKDGRTVSINTENNRSVIITPEKRLVEAKYETWYDGFVRLRWADSSIWRDKNDKCYKPSCPNKNGCKC